MRKFIVYLCITLISIPAYAWRSGWQEEAYLSAINTTGNVTVGGNLSVTGTSTLTGNVTASGTLGVTGATTLTGGASIPYTATSTALSITTTATSVVTSTPMVSLARSGNFTASASDAILDFSNIPSSTITEPASGSASYIANYMAMNSVNVTAGAGALNNTTLNVVACTDTDANSNIAISTTGDNSFGNGTHTFRLGATDEFIVNSTDTDRTDATRVFDIRIDSNQATATTDIDPVLIDLDCDSGDTGSAHAFNVQCETGNLANSERASCMQIIMDASNCNTATSNIYGIWVTGPTSGTNTVESGIGVVSGWDYGYYVEGADFYSIFVDGGAVRFDGAQINAPEAITATSAGVAASTTIVCTEVTTNGDSDLDDVTLADGSEDGVLKEIYCVVEGNAADTWKITPANMIGGTQITFAGAGEGCILRYDAGVPGWCVVGNNGGTIS